MSPTPPLPPSHEHPLDYLLIGHVTQDVVPSGFVLGGTVSYSAMAVAALGLRVGIITAAPDSVDLSTLADFPILCIPCEEATTFENIQTPEGRIQYLHKRAPTLTAIMIPPEWQQAAIVHFAPVAYEIDASLVELYADEFKCITPQGCLRTTDENKRVHYRDWAEADLVMPQMEAAVISVEDVQYNEERIQRLQKHARILAVTEGEQGARIYWNGDVRHCMAPKVSVVDPTGAGDIFAAIFFARLQTTRDAWLAGAQAVRLASLSVTRRGVEGMPTAEEVRAAVTEILPEKETR
jgi:sugar/nucleoside kinase (ribokinase family)